MTAYYCSMAALIVGAYLLGNVNFSVLISRHKKRDIRSYGSGNPGTINMLRNFGIGLGILTLVLDALKGAVAAVVGWWLLGNGFTSSEGAFAFAEGRFGLYLGGLFAVIGHIFPVFFKFKGGKGVATTIGVCFVASPLMSLVAFVLCLVFLLTVKVGCLTSFIAICIPLIYNSVLAFGSGKIEEAVLALVNVALVVCAHHSNIARMFRGEEKQLYLFGQKKSALHSEELVADLSAENDGVNNDEVSKENHTRAGE